eukprot:9160396-Lingulodinium_polyedra.AAC.1
MDKTSRVVTDIEDDVRAFRKQQVFSMQAQLASQRRDAATKFIMTGCERATEEERNYMIDWIMEENNIRYYRAQHQTYRDR